MSSASAEVRFVLPPGSEASAPPEARGLQWMLSAHDVVNTLAMPLVIIVLLRLHSARSATP